MFKLLHSKKQGDFMEILPLEKEIVFCEKDFYKGIIFPKSLLLKFQEIAGDHAEILGLGFQELMKKNLVWIITRLKYEILKPIPKNTPLILQTFPEPKGMLDFNRDYLIKDKSGQVFVKGISKWCLMDFSVRKIVKLQEIDYLGECLLPSVFEGKFLKTENFVPENPPVFEYLVKKEDIDVNNHLNNAEYAKIIFKAMNEKKFNFLQINFINEAKLGEIIKVFVLEEENSTKICGKLESQKTCFTAEVKL